MSKIVKRIVTAVLAAVGLIVFVVGGYVIYLFVDYERIQDNLELAINNNMTSEIMLGTEYTIMTYNLGFGAYDREFSFFMDVGDSKAGERRVGKSGKARSKEADLQNINGALDTIVKKNPDFVFTQETDVDSDRSYHVNQLDLLREKTTGYANVFAYNFRSSYLFYPFSDPHGKSNSGMITLSRYKIQSSMRKSFPVDTGISKFFDLDRCFVVTRLNVSDKQLVLINVHMSAYDEGGKIRAKQLKMLSEFISEEYAKGNYVIVGGDFNHDICGSVGTFETDEVKPDWIASIEPSDLPDGFSVAIAQNKSEVATCRSCDIPYEPGKNYQAIVDGFIVSANVEATAINVDTGYEFSDHNPVLLRFRLLS